MYGTALPCTMYTFHIDHCTVKPYTRHNISYHVTLTSQLISCITVPFCVQCSLLPLLTPQAPDRLRSALALELMHRLQPHALRLGEQLGRRLGRRLQARLLVAAAPPLWHALGVARRVGRIGGAPLGIRAQRLAEGGILDVALAQLVAGDGAVAVDVERREDRARGRGGLRVVVAREVRGDLGLRNLAVAIRVDLCVTGRNSSREM